VAKSVSAVGGDAASATGQSPALPALFAGPRAVFDSPETRLCRLFRIRFHSTRGEPAGPFSEDSRQGLTTVVAMFGAQLHTHPPAAQLGEPRPIAFPPCLPSQTCRSRAPRRVSVACAPPVAAAIRTTRPRARRAPCPRNTTADRREAVHPSERDRGSRTGRRSATRACS
jgi:hypothetical protein